MTVARSMLINLSATPFYHCMTRCVRRSYLCGTNKETGQDYSHRKYWLVARFKELASIFAIKICAYAVMDNHYHLILFVDEAQSQRWSDEEVKARWGQLFRQDAEKLEEKGLSPLFIQQKIMLWRQRLASISWFMRCLNEPIARLSNKEDNCSGRFWEGRYKSQALLDEGAVLSAMAYVDLNPIRANLASTPENSDFTSIQERIQYFVKQQTQKCDEAKQPKTLMAFANNVNLEKSPFPLIDFKLSDYLYLVEITGKILRDDKKGAIPQDLAPILSRINLSSGGWLSITSQLEEQFYLSMGNELSMMDFGNRTKISKPKGITAARQCYLPAA